MKRHLLPVFLLLALLSIQASSASAESLRLPAIFGDHMVLQRDLPVAVWGWAQAGQAVSVSFKGQTVTTQADDTGKWRVDLEPLDADAEPAQMTVSGGDQTLTVDDVLVGEVWLCSGQSNMEWAVDRADRAEEEVAAADWPLIRHIKAPKRPSMLPMDDIEADWEVCSPQTVGKFTAVGYFFGRKLHQELDVPIGLVNCSWGGTRIEPWVPLEAYAKVPALKAWYEKIAAKQPGSAAYQAVARAYIDGLSDWLERSERQLEEHDLLTEPEAFPDQLKPYTDRQNPTTLYNGMMRPFIPFTIRGSIWYQGESNRTEGKVYLELTRALVLGWREKWERPDLPYYYVQIAPYKYGDENPRILAQFWEVQGEIEKQIEHTGMVVVNDIGNTQDIHPTNKQDVGARLANMALRRDYGRSKIVDSGPRHEAMRVEGDRLMLTFTHVGEGLASRDGEALGWFELAGEAQPWTAADAEIVAPDTLAISAEGIDKPVAVRFAWHKLAEPNLVNSVGLPTAPFRAGEAPKLDFLSLNVPESKGYELIYELDLSKLGHEINYEVDHTASFQGTFDRVAYYVELGDGDGESRWVYVSMDAFTDELNKIGVPTLASGASFQQPVENMVVHSNARGIPNSIGLTGNIEFWPNNYGQANHANVPGASGSVYDTGDAISTGTPDGYGSMQVHVSEPGVTLFAVNHWKMNPFDLGIGTNTQDGAPDWTFTKLSDRYPVKRMKVFVRPDQR